MKNLSNTNRLSVLSIIVLTLFTFNISWAQCVDEVFIDFLDPEPTSVVITWSPVFPEDGINYDWEIRTSGAPGTLLAGYVVSGNAPNGTNSVTVSGLQYDTEYFAYVRYNCDATTSSPWQATDSNPFTTQKLRAPVATPAILISNNSFIAKWNPVLGASSYRLDVSANSTFTSILASYSDITVNTIYKLVDIGITPTTQYWYRVRAVGNNGTGEFTTADSNIITLTTTAVSTGISIWDGMTWINGAPDATVDAIINGNYDTATNGTFDCKSLLVNSGKILTIQSTGPLGPNGRYVRIYGTLVNEAGPTGVVVESNGNLIQRDGANNIENVGAITVKRNSNPLWRLDYTIWSSPVTGSQTLGQFSPDTSPNRFYSYESFSDKYFSIPSTTVSVAGSGYLIRMPNDWVSNPSASLPLTTPGPAAAWTGVFTGIPNASNLILPLSKSGNGYNIIGNPYPSALSATAFLTINNFFNDNIGNTLYYWRRTNDITGAGSAANSFYASYTVFGGTAAADAPTLIPNALISKGQGFLVQANLSALDPSVSINNLMRDPNYPAQFLRKANQAEEQVQTDENDGVERNRLWLNLTSAEGGFGQTLLGYATDASNGLDRNDGKYFNDGALALTSYLDNKEYIIQARALPFVDTDVVPLLFKTPFAGDYTISIAQMDGFFAEGQAVYIKDNLTNTGHNLNEGPYNFSSEVGVFPARFEVVYNASSLSTKNPILDANAVVVYKSNQALNINSGAIAMKSVELYDMSGRVIYKKENIDNTKLAISNLNFQDQIIIIKINTEAGIVNKKYSFTR